MLESLKKNESFEYTKLTPEEMSAKGILGRLVGECADVINPTRNGRRYGEELWDKVFHDPLVLEKIKNKCLFGEFGHPIDDREEVDPEKIAIALNEIPKKDSQGRLIALFDILDTPCGRILKTVCDYGTTIGISSRGTGEVIGEDVDPDSYDFECFDAVILPAVETARLQYVREGVDKNLLRMKKALTEELSKASDDDKIVMKKQLEELNIKLDECDDKEESSEKECINGSCADKQNKESENEGVEKTKEAEDNRSDELVNALTEALNAKQVSEAKLLDLQNKLAASDARVNELIEEVDKFKKVSISLSNKALEAKKLAKDVTSLTEQLKKKEQEIESHKNKIQNLEEARKKQDVSSKKLTESISSRNTEINKLNENLDRLSKMYDEEIKELKESFESEKRDQAKALRDAKAKAEQNAKLAESYKKLANNVAESYIEAKALMLNVEPNDIKAKLGKGYKLADIDRICESLQQYSLNMRKLPFNVDRKVKVKFTESKNDNMIMRSDIDDTIDDDLLKLAKINR